MNAKGYFANDGPFSWCYCLYRRNERNKSLHEIYRGNDWEGAWSESCLYVPWGGGVK
jgi:hypothetical protein